MTEPQKPARKTGISHFFAAAGYSLGGLQRLARESAFRQEAAIGGAGFALLIGFGAGVERLLGFVVIWLALFAVEALNTAIEVLVDHLSPQWSQFAKDAKDLGSFAVACMIGALTLYTLWALFL